MEFGASAAGRALRKEGFSSAKYQSDEIGCSVSLIMKFSSANPLQIIANEQRIPLLLITNNGHDVRQQAPWGKTNILLKQP
ncbi:hypothetical protein J7444_16985 [Labrenzia sp. R4_1]|uniref:hypothetical protein n=1 Tax=Labrenzia sp. R4_1 TaxID=2821106 RepID=UPI001ADB676E|nr:hypothetical protein [Labrenzia sp. R4_1]MBO9426439.1 hypothetical protein [Labrenzia sp. R4_1]